MAENKEFKTIFNSVYGTYGLPSNMFANVKTEAEKELESKIEEKEEKWIWIEGYKGTDRDMKCRDYQFEMNKVHEMDKDAKIELCNSGFHLCTKLEDVFSYYHIGDGNRFFRVRALVREAEFKAMTEKKQPKDTIYLSLYSRNDKLTSKAIQFLYELTPAEILKNTEANAWNDEDQRLAIDHGINKARELRNREALLECGYSEAFVEYLIAKGETKVALQVGSQKDLSMDMKVLLIAHEILD
jgi:hypothetical protein